MARVLLRCAFGAVTLVSVALLSLQVPLARISLLSGVVELVGVLTGQQWVGRDHWENVAGVWEGGSDRRCRGVYTIAWSKRGGHRAVAPIHATNVFDKQV